MACSRRLLPEGLRNDQWVIVRPLRLPELSARALDREPNPPVMASAPMPDA
jgi:hypothetical protein